MATVTREQLQKALSSLSALEGMASGYCELQDGFDTSKGIAENVRQLLAALASPPAEDEHALPTKADAWSLHAYVVDHAADHDDDCPGDDTCDCQFRARNEAVSRCVRWLIERPRAPQAPPASDPPGLVANWRPIETAPKRTDVLAGWADRPHWLPQVLQQDDAGMWISGEESDYRPPTHWMPLPASPQAETKGDE